MKKFNLILLVVGSLLATQALATTGPIAWWKLDEGTGTNAADSSGNDLGATLINGATWASGIFSNALQFNGAGSEANAPTSSALNVTNSLSMSVWVNTTNNANQVVLSYRTEEFDSGWRLFYQTGAYFFQWASASNDFETVGVGGSFPSNQWTHLAVTLTQTSVLLYLNGSPVASGGNPHSNVWLAAGYPLRIGRTDGGGAYWFQGKVDDVRIYDRALSSNEVAALFNTDSIGDGIPNWWRQEYFGTGSTTNSNSCATCDPDTDGYNNLQEYNFSTDPTNSASYPATIPPNLIGWWKLDEGTGTNTADSSGNNNTGQLVGGPAWTSGIFSNALQFDGASTEVNAQISNSLNVTNALTISAWVHTSNSIIQAVASYRAEEYDSGWRLFYIPSHILFQWTSPTGSFHSLDAFGTYPSNQWANLAVTFSETNVLIYLDGIQIASDNNPGSNLWFTANNPLRIGRTDNGNAYRFQGTIDDVRLYNRVLGTNELAAMNSLDSIGDGIPDWWRFEHFGSATTTNSSSCATCDADGDTYNNLQEFILGTDPTSSVSFPPAVSETNQVTSAPIIDWEFNGTFDAASQALSLTPTNRAFFYRVGDTIGITNTDSGFVDVWNVKGGRVYRGAASSFSTNLPPGHYFAESKTDRIQFCVVPSGYTDAPGWGSDVEATYADYYAYDLSAGIRTIRFFAYWPNITLTNDTWGDYQFTSCFFQEGCGGGVDDAVAEAAATTNNLIFQLGFWPSYVTTSTVCSLDEYLTYVTDFCTHIANTPHGSNVVTGLTLWNEPWYQNDFRLSVPDAGSDDSPNDGWDWSSQPFNGTPTTFLHWLTAMYTNAVPIIHRILPNTKIYGISAQDWQVGEYIQTNILAYGGLDLVDGIDHHFYDSIGRPDEPINEKGLSLDQWIDLAKSEWPTNNPLFIMDEYAIMGNSLAVGSTKSVLGIIQNGGDTNIPVAGLMDWWNGYCDMAKDAVIFASRSVLPIFQVGMMGDHGGSYQDLWFDGFAAGAGSLTRGPYPRISAWAAVWHQLKGLSFVSQATSTNGIISYTFASGGTTNVFRWCIRGASANLSSAQDCKDVFGNTEHTALITDEPLIFNQ